jgi:hypothetical protein
VSIEGYGLGYKGKYSINTNAGRVVTLTNVFIVQFTTCFGLYRPSSGAGLAQSV